MKEKRVNGKVRTLTPRNGYLKTSSVKTVLFFGYHICIDDRTGSVWDGDSVD